MGLYDNPFPPETTQKMFGRWISIVKRQECASVALLPRSDRHYRIAQFLSSLSTTDTKDTVWVSVSFQSFVAERWNEFVERLDVYRVQDKRVVFLVKDAEWLFTAAPHLITKLQEYVLRPYRQTSFIFFFEKNILDTGISDILSVCPALFQNISVQPLYEQEEVIHYIRHLEGLYGFSLTMGERSEIWHQTRGYIWLTTEAVRHAHETGHISFDHPAIQFRFQAVWEGFTQKEQQLLIAVARNGKVSSDFNEPREFFLNAKLLTREGDAYAITAPIVSRFVKQVVHQINQITLDHDSLFINHARIDSLISVRERMLLVYLLNHKTIILSRDTTAEILWGKDWQEQCSDWALDQAIRRLRNRLEQLGLSKQLIQTVKGKGYRYGDQI
mgnify:FL=1